MQVHELTESQKHLLINQIANNFSGNYISYIDKDNIHQSEFVLVVGGQEVLRMSECNCAEQFNRYKSPYRFNIEKDIVKLIVREIPNNLEQIRLVCLGSDWVGLSVILAKLYQLGYKDFSIFNVEFPYSLEQEILRNEIYLKFWKELFLDSKIECVTVAGVDDNNVLLSSANMFFTSKLIVFAEDLGGTRPNSTKIFNGVKGATKAINLFVDEIIRNKQILNEPPSQQIFCVYGNNIIKSIFVNISNGAINITENSCSDCELPIEEINFRHSKPKLSMA